MEKLKLSFSRIEEAESRIRPFVLRTALSPARAVPKPSGLKPGQLFFKWESEQKTGSFKIRGALNKALSLTDSERARGLMAASAGNHAQGVAFAARAVGAKARVVMMEQASKTKIQSAKSLGAEVILKGKTYDESFSHALRLQGGSLFIHPFADPLIMAGQGTVGLEIARALPKASSVIASVGGGGLISGLACAIKALVPSCRVYGAVWDGSLSLYERFCRLKGLSPPPASQFKNRLLPETGLTDGVAAEADERMPPVFSHLVDDIAPVSKKEIARAMAWLKKHEGRIAEGAGAAAMAALLSQARPRRWNLGENCCVIVSGGNIDPARFEKIIKKARF